LNAGKLEARDAALAEIRPRLGRIEGAWQAGLDAFEQGREAMLHAADRDLVRLALLIAERIVKRQILADPSIVLDQLRAVLAVVARATALAVRVHPDDVPLLEQAMPALAARFGAARHAELMADPSLDRGSCIAEMRGTQAPAGADASSIAGGEIDASISTQLQRIAEALLPGAAVMEDRTPDDRP
ncbi:MAG: FliH/SctL family protein, partial [Phycisphaerales bacterium]